MALRTDTLQPISELRRRPAHSPVQRRAAAIINGVDICAALNKKLRSTQLVEDATIRERSLPVFIARIYVETLVDHRAHQPKVLFVDCFQELIELRI